jgi:uncharacterized protein YjiK
MMQKLFQTQCPVFFGVLLVCAATLCYGCKQHGYGSPAGYNIEKPAEVQLGKVLNEISGLSFYPPAKSFLTVADDKEKVIEIRLKDGKLRDVSGKVLEKKGDPEDLVYLDSIVYVLLSRGVLQIFPYGAQDTSDVQNVSLALGGENDFETAYYDSSANGVIIMCKNCEHERGQNLRTAYRLDLDTKVFDSIPFFTIQISEIENLLKDKTVKFDPSAAAINPIDNRLYILSSAGHLLVITDTRGKVLEAYNLNPDKYPQPEGISFAPNGHMYISNEAKYGTPTLLSFPYKKSSKK